jgi:hypothetical protein
MTAPTIERPHAERPEPLPPVFAVRAEVEPHADVRHFDEEIDAAIQSAAATGSFEALREALHTWLGIALMAKNADQHVRLPFEHAAAAR